MIINLNQGQQQPPQPQHQVPVPFLRQDTGLGDVIARMTQAVGVQSCTPCKRRQEEMNHWLRFTSAW